MFLVQFYGLFRVWDVLLNIFKNESKLLRTQYYYTPREIYYNTTHEEEYKTIKNAIILHTKRNTTILQYYYNTTHQEK